MIPASPSRHTGPKRILFFPDKISGEDSGARSARATLRSMLELGHSVGVFAADADQMAAEPADPRIRYYTPRSAMRADSHFFEPRLLAQFRGILAEFKPDYYFMAGAIQKPALLARAARAAGVKTIFLFYGTDYYCAKGFAGLESGPCFRCMERSPLEALRNGCIRQEPKLVHFVKSAMVRRQLRGEILRSDRVVGYSEDQLGVYGKFGIEAEKRAKISLQFDRTELDGIPTADGDYFLIIGQPSIEKGWHTLAAILTRCTTSPKIRMGFSTLEVEQRTIARFGLAPFVASGMIETVRAIDSRRGILEMIASARAMLIPSYYPTTGEFVLSESLILGKPVLVYDAGAHKSFLMHRQNAMVAQIGDFDAFARHLDEVNTSSEVRQSLSIGARSLAATLYSDEARLDSLSKLFQ